jgi:membrane associated rhomboid family serine protease
MSIADDLKLSFRKGNVLVRIIYINAIIFIALNLLFVSYMLFSHEMRINGLKDIYNEKFLSWLMVPSLPAELIRKPWTIITYMFTHFNFLHIFFNMLMLYWFGRIFLQFFSPRQFLSTYLIGGMAGALFFILLFNITPGLYQFLGTRMLGASAAVMAIVIATAFYMPDYNIYLLFIGQVKLKYVALFMLLLDVLFIASYNAGGHIAHLGGAAYGYYFTMRVKKGRDPGKWINTILDSLVTLLRPRPKLNVTYRSKAKYMSDEEYNKEKADMQKEIDKILDKIAGSGYDSLTKKEKETLFKMNREDKP